MVCLYDTEECHAIALRGVGYHVVGHYCTITYEGFRKWVTAIINSPDFTIHIQH